MTPTIYLYERFKTLQITHDFFQNKEYMYFLLYLKFKRMFCYLGHR